MLYYKNFIKNKKHLLWNQSKRLSKNQSKILFTISGYWSIIIYYSNRSL